MMKWSFVSAVILLVLISAGLAQSQENIDAKGSNVLFIFDSSGSMKKKLDSGQSRSDVAKGAMVAALSRLPEGAKPGLMMYGHRRAKDCSDIEAVAPVGVLSGSDIATIIAESKPRGETPIADSLMRAAASFTAMPGQANSIVLVTDGIEECGGDPCAAARAVKAMGLDIKAHVVGFTLNAEQRATVQCIADETGGKYFDAQNAESLSAALEEVKTQVSAPPTPTYTSVFRDDFDGTALLPHWTIANGRSDSHAVYGGTFLLASSRAKSDAPGNEPLFTLSGVELPQGDWIAQAIVEFGMQTAQDGFAVSLVKGETRISAELGAKGDQYDGWMLFARVAKVTPSETITFDIPIRKSPCLVCKDNQMLPALVAKVAQPIELQLVKEGRNFYAKARETGQDKWFATDKVTMLGGGGSISLGAFQRAATTGESYAITDKIEILKKDEPGVQQ